MRHKTYHPLAFLTNLHCYVESGSRIIADLIGTTTGGGCYVTIKDWLSNLAAKPPQVSEKDVGHAFDNNQKVGKAWRVSVNNNKFSTSVITTHIWFPLGNTCLQNDLSLKPIQWVSDRNIIDKIRREEEPVFGELDEIHLESLTYFIDASIRLVDSEQQVNDSDNFTDRIDRLVEERMTIVCSTCLKDGISISYPRSKRKCDICQTVLTKQISTGNEMKVANSIVRVEVKECGMKKTVVDAYPMRERYGQIPAKLPNQTPQPKTGEPSFVDPNSFSSCTFVLRKIGREAGIMKYGTGTRQWLIICCDGLPFRLCHIIVNNTYTCTECKVSLFREEEVAMHNEINHPIESATMSREFDWVLLKPAGGHFEMNSIKSFFELNWDTFLGKLCDAMGFKSEAAKYVAKACKDHHKAWELILIFFFASLRELVTVYVRETKSSSPDATLSAAGFFQFTKTKSNKPSFLYLFSQVTNYAFAIINFRMGIRRNNYKVTLSAVHKLGGLFHGRNHPFYQLIEVYYMSRLFTLQKEVELLYHTYYTISVSGDPSRAEDWDFVLENINKKTQSWIPKGIPTDKIWQNVCRNIDPLEELRMMHFEMAGIKASSSSNRPRHLADEIDEFRAVIRESSVLESSKFCGIENNELDPELLNFTSLSKIHRYYKIGSMFLDEEISDERLSHPIFITPQERAKSMDISTMTKKKIKEKCVQMINEILCLDTLEYYQEYFNTSVKDRKADLIQFYYDVKNTVERIRAEVGPTDIDCESDNTEQ